MRATVATSSLVPVGRRAVPPWSPPDWLTIQRAVLLGFGVLLVLWLASGYDSMHRMIEVELRSSAISARFARSDDLISSVARQTLQASVRLRNVLMATGPARTDADAGGLVAWRTSVDQALQQYEGVTGSVDELRLVERLKLETKAFWDAVLRPEEGGAASPDLATQVSLVIGQRDAVLELVDQIRALNRAGFQREQAANAATYRAAQRRVWLTSAAAIVLGLGIAFLVTHHAGDLETRIRQQLVKDAQNTRDLQRLSARIVGAQEEERRSIARELHDEIGQALTAIKVEVAVAQRGLDAAGCAAHSLDDVRMITDHALQAVRDLSQLLHPALLEDMGLPAALDRYLRNFSTRTGIQAQLLQDRMEERLASQVEICAYRIVQEAMTNIVRHAEASSCRVYLQRLPNTLLLTVEDDGKGFDPKGAAGPPAGLGLLGVQERVSGLRGTFRLESQPGKGTRLTVELPALPREIGPVEAD